MTSTLRFVSMGSAVSLLALVIAGGCGDSAHTLGSTGDGGRGGGSAGSGGTTPAGGAGGAGAAGRGGAGGGGGMGATGVAGGGGGGSGTGGGGATGGVTGGGGGGRGGGSAGESGTGGRGGSAGGAGGAAGLGGTGGSAGSGNTGGGGAAGTAGRGGTGGGGSGGAGGVTGTGGTFAANACLTVQTLDRSCATDNDCFAAVNIADCCGRGQFIGLRTTEQARYTSLEQQCQATWPACTCATGPTFTDDGSLIKNGMTVGVTCHQGVCTTFVPACGGPCTGGLTCFSCQTAGARFAACTTRCTDTAGSSDCTNPALPRCQTAGSGNIEGTYCTTNVMCDIR